MTGKNHLLFGIGAGTLLYMSVILEQDTNEFVHVPVFTKTLISSSLGALISDIDNPKSMIGRRLLFLSYPINKLVGHRTLFHSFSLIAIILCIGYILTGGIDFTNNLYFISFVTGFLGHLFQDTFTKKGCPLLWPFIRTHVSFTKQKCGNISELPITICILIAYGFFMLRRLEIVEIIHLFLPIY